MIKLRTIALLLILLLVSIAGYSRAEVEIVPIINANLIGGQYVYISTYPAPGSLGGNVNIDVTPAVSFGDKISLIPTVSYNYYGIKDVTELVGGGTLFNQRMDIIGSGKLIFKLGDKLRLKGGGSYKQEFLIETTAETWGNGLFDYTKWTAGGEIEAILNDKDDSIRAGYNFYQLGFSNYEALISKYGDEFSELQQTPGAKVLDYNAHEIFAEGGIQFSENFMLNYNFLMTLKDFPDQYVINSFATYSSTDTRNDNSNIHSIDVKFLVPMGENLKVVFNLGGQLSTYGSDQNHYDVGRFQYIANYYDYSGIKISPAASLYFGNPAKPTIININTAFAIRAYDTRLAQDSAGTYGTDKITNTSILIGASVSFPVTTEISFKVRANFFNKASNMEYEAFYKYNYSTLNYFAGIAVEFD